MLSDPFSYQALGTDPKSGAAHRLRGYAKFQTLLVIISKLEQWAAKAQKDTQTTKDGDKRADVKRWFAEGLIEIWIMIGYKKPTITSRYDCSKTTGALMEFTNAAARPQRRNKTMEKKGPKSPR